MSEALSRSQLLNTLDHLRQQWIDVLETALWRNPDLGDSEYLGLCLVKQLLRITPQGIERTAGNLITGRHQLPQDRPLAHNLRIAPDIGC